MDDIFREIQGIDPSGISFEPEHVDRMLTELVEQTDQLERVLLGDAYMPGKLTATPLGKPAKDLLEMLKEAIKFENIEEAGGIMDKISEDSLDVNGIGPDAEEAQKFYRSLIKLDNSRRGKNEDS